MSVKRSSRMRHPSRQRIRALSVASHPKRRPLKKKRGRPPGLRMVKTSRSSTCYDDLACITELHDDDGLEATIVVSPHDIEDDVVDSSWEKHAEGCHVSRQSALHTPDQRNTTSLERDAMHSLTVWISVAQHCQGRIPHGSVVLAAKVGHVSTFNMIRVTGCLRALIEQQTTDIDATVMRTIEQQVLTYCLPLLEAFSSFCSNADGSYCAQKRRRTCDTPAALEPRLVLNLGVVGCLDLFLTAASLPHCNLFAEYSKSHNLILFLSNFLRFECMDTFNLYVNTISPNKGSKRATSKNVVSSRRATATFPLVEWNTSFLQSFIHILTAIGQLVNTNTMPDVVLYGIISLALNGLKSTCLPWRQERLWSPSAQSLIGMLHQLLRELLLMMYRRYVHLTDHIESALVDAIPTCIPSTFKRRHGFPALMLLLLSLPYYCLEGGSYILKEEVTRVITNHEEACTRLEEAADGLQKCVQRVTLLILRRCLLTQDSTEPHSDFEKRYTSLRKTPQLDVFIQWLCEGSTSLKYPTSLIYLQHVSTLLCRVVLCTLPFSTEEDQRLAPHATLCGTRGLTYGTKSTALVLLQHIVVHLLKQFPLDDVSSAGNTDGPDIQRCTACQGLCDAAHATQCGVCHRQYHAFCVPHANVVASNPGEASWTCDECFYKDSYGRIAKGSTVRRLRQVGLESLLQQSPKQKGTVAHALRWLWSPTQEGSTTHRVSAYLRYAVCLVGLLRQPVVANGDCGRAMGSESFSRVLPCWRPSGASSAGLRGVSPWLAQASLDYDTRVRYCVVGMVGAWAKSHVTQAGTTLRGETWAQEPTSLLLHSRFTRPTRESGVCCVCQESGCCSTWCFAQFAVELCFCRSALCGNRTTCRDGLDDDEDERRDTRARDDYHVQQLWKYCCAPLCDPLLSTVFKVIVAAQHHPQSIPPHIALMALGDCCVEHHWLLIHPLFGVQVVRYLIRGLESCCSRSCCSILCFIARAWGRIERILNTVASFGNVISRLDSQGHGPCLAPHDQAVLPFLTQDACCAFLVCDPSLCASWTPETQSKLTMTSTLVATRALEIIFRLFVPLAVKTVQHTSPAVRLESCRVLKCIVATLSLHMRLVPYAVSQLASRLNCADELEDMRYSAACVFNDVYIKGALEKTKGVLLTTNSNSAPDWCYVDSLVQTLSLTGDLCVANALVVPTETRKVQHLRQLWYNVKDQETQPTQTPRAEEPSHTSPCAVEPKRHRVSTESRSSPRPQTPRGARRQARHRWVVDRHLPVFTQVLLYGLVGNQYDFTYIDHVFQHIVFQLLPRFIEQHHNHTSEVNEATECLNYIRATRVLLGIHLPDISFLWHWIPYLQGPCDTNHHALVLVEVCCVIATGTMTWCAMNRWASELQHGGSSVPLANDVVRHLCVVEDALLDRLIPCNSRSVIGAALHCLCVSVFNVTFNFSHVIEPTLADCLALLLPLRHLLNQSAEARDTVNASTALLRYGLTALARPRTAQRCVNVTIDENNQELLHKQMSFVVEGLKRRVWMLGVLSSLIDFQRDLAYDLPPLPLYEQRSAPQRTSSATARATPHTLGQGPQGSTRPLLPTGSGALYPKGNTLRELSDMCGNVAEKAPTSLCTLSRTVHTLVKYIVGNLATCNWEAHVPQCSLLLARVTEDVVQASCHLAQYIFHLLLDLFNHVDTLCTALQASEHHTGALQILLLQTLQLFLAKHHWFLTSQKWSVTIQHVLGHFDNRKLQLAGIRTVIALASHMTTAGLSPQPLSVYGDALVFVFRGYSVRKSSPCDRQGCTSFLQCVNLPKLQTTRTDSGLHVQMAAFDALVVLHTHGLLNPSIFFELCFASLFHTSDRLRHDALVQLEQSLENSMINTLFLSRIASLFNHAFLTMILSVLRYPSSAPKNVCCSCGLHHLSTVSTSGVPLFYTFYKEHPHYFSTCHYQRIITCVTSFLLHGADPFVLGVLITGASPMDVPCCHCSSSVFLRHLMSRFSMSFMSALNTLLRIFFLQWSAFLLISLPYKQPQHSAYIVKLITSTLLNEISTFFNIQLCSTSPNGSPKPDSSKPQPVISTPQLDSSTPQPDSSKPQPDSSKHQIFLNTTYTFDEPHEHFTQHCVISSKCFTGHSEETLNQQLARYVNGEHSTVPETFGYLSTMLLSLSLLMLMAVGHCVNTSRSNDAQQRAEPPPFALPKAPLKSTSLSLKHLTSPSPLHFLPCIATAIEDLWNTLLTTRPFPIFFADTQRIIKSVAQHLNIFQWDEDASSTYAPATGDSRRTTVAKRGRPKKKSM